MRACEAWRSVEMPEATQHSSSVLPLELLGQEGDARGMKRTRSFLSRVPRPSTVFSSGKRMERRICGFVFVRLFYLGFLCFFFLLLVSSLRFTPYPPPPPRPALV